MKKLYIEGTSNTVNGNLREAFSKLLEKELKGKMPRIIMGESKNHTIDSFFTEFMNPKEERFLLVDSDEPTPNKQQICDDNNLNFKDKRQIDSTPTNTFLMIQEAEAWLLSQPEVLVQAGIDMSKFNCLNVESIKDPSEKLADLYKKSGKTYNKVRDFAIVFPKLDTTKLKQTCPEFLALINALNN